MTILFAIENMEDHMNCRNQLWAVEVPCYVLIVRKSFGLNQFFPEANKLGASMYKLGRA